MNYKIDLHTHSIISHDGGLEEKDYKNLLERKILDYVAITDHNTISFAQNLQKKLGERIIVGEEIMTSDGEIIGLFLTRKVNPHLSTRETVQQIHAQNGLAYIPHPFEKLRKGLQLFTLKQIANSLDIIEIFNARGLNALKQKSALQFAKDHNLGMAASSDAHCGLGVGSAFSIVTAKPNKENLSKLLKTAEFRKNLAPFPAFFCPMINKIKKVLNI